jgi:hypothetical protein
VQGLAAGLGVPPDAYVCSPTYALWSQHRGRLPLYHVDLYRLADPEEATFIGYEDLFDGVAVVAIEWFDAFPELWPAGFLRIALADDPVVPEGSQSLEDAGPETRGGRVPHAPRRRGNGEDSASNDWDSELELGRRSLVVSGVGERHETLAGRYRAAILGAGLALETGQTGER